MKNTLLGLATAGIIAMGATTAATVYRSIQVSDEAKNKVVDYSKVLKLSQRDTASKMIMSYDRTKEIFWNRNDINSEYVYVKLVAKMNDSYIDVTTFASSTPNVGYYKIDKNYADGLPFTYVEVGCIVTPHTECSSSTLIPVF